MAGKVDPVEDIDVINFELALADITQIEKRLERIAKGRAKTKEEIASNEVQLFLPYCCNWQQPSVEKVKGHNMITAEKGFTSCCSILRSLACST